MLFQRHCQHPLSYKNTPRLLKRSSIYALFSVSFHSQLWILIQMKTAISILCIPESPALSTMPGTWFVLDQYLSNKRMDGLIQTHVQILVCHLYAIQHLDKCLNPLNAIFFFLKLGLSILQNCFLYISCLANICGQELYSINVIPFILFFLHHSFKFSSNNCFSNTYIYLYWKTDFVCT